MNTNILQFKRTILFLIRIINLAVATLLFALVWFLFYSEPIKAGAAIEYYYWGHWLIILIYAILLASFTQLYGGYKIGDDRISEIFISNTVSILFVNSIYYCFIGLIWHGIPNPFVIIIMTLFQLIYILCWCVYSNRTYFKLYSARNILYLYESELPGAILAKMKARHDKYNVSKCIQIDSLFDFVVNIQGYDAVALDRVSAPLRMACIHACFDQNIRLYLTPSFDDTVLASSMTINLMDTPIFLMKNRGLSFEQKLMKRILDIIISICAIIVLSPIMLITAICIKCDDGGSVLYKQTRLTINGASFKIYKFRSMIKEAEKDGVARLMKKDDKRLTRAGKTIRKLRIDELPQLWNVLKGDMSIIGPRPERPQIAKKYCKDIPEFKYRLNGKPGITGYAQVMGKYNTTPHDKLIYDLLYLENFSLILDIKISFMTFKTLVKSDASEGI